MSQGVMPSCLIVICLFAPLTYVVDEPIGARCNWKMHSRNLLINRVISSGSSIRTVWTVEHCAKM